LIINYNAGSGDIIDNIVIDIDICRTIEYFDGMRLTTTALENIVSNN